MLSLIWVTVSEAMRTLRAKPLNTFLSTLGIVIGVGALVSILALGDGLEAFGRQEMANTSNISSILVVTPTTTEIEGISIAKPAFTPLSIAHVQEMTQLAGTDAKAVASTGFTAMVRLDTIQKPVELNASNLTELPTNRTVQYGRFLNAADQTDSVIFINHTLASKLTPDTNLATLLDKRIRLGTRNLRIIGIMALRDNEQSSRATLPIALLDTAILRKNPPTLTITPAKMEDIPVIKAKIETWADANFPGGKNELMLITDESRLKQMLRGIMVFKLVMGMIVGIAILVGGIGVMNVLLMSVAERTREIGIRKAIGAKRSVIAFQFMTESLAISLAGSFMGILLGMGFMAIAVPLIKSFTEVTFPVAFEPGSMFIILIVSLMVGFIFGTYPAWKASRLTPVEAIRHE